MAGRGSYLVSLPVVAGLLGGLTLGLLLLGRYYGLGLVTFALLAVPVVLAIGYLAWYRTLPYEPPRPRPKPAKEEEEPFEDPVEEADRHDKAANDGAPDGPPADPPDEPDEEPAVPSAARR
ncbi:MAG: hypothetical protein ABSA63_09575 [Thermoplasmata archaeon]|jgi:hypothetical protein